MVQPNSKLRQQKAEHDANEKAALVKNAQELDSIKSRLEQSFKQEYVTIEHKDIPITCRAISTEELKEFMSSVYAFYQLQENPNAITPEYISELIDKFAILLANASIDKSLDKEFWSQSSIKTQISLLMKLVKKVSDDNAANEKMIDRFRDQ